MGVWNTKHLLDAMKKDKAAKQGKTCMAIIKNIGEPYTLRKEYFHPVDRSVIRKAIARVKQGFDE